MIDPDPPKRKKSEGWKIKLVKKFFEANPEATIPEVSRACRASASTVSRARRELLEAGVLAPAPTGRPRLDRAATPADSAPDDPEQVDALIRADIDRAVQEGRPPLTRMERRQRLSAYADHPRVPTQAKIAALKELEATEPPDSGPLLGPGPPLTRADRVHRTALILEALFGIDGPDAVADATQRATRAAGVPDAGPDRSQAAVDDPPPPDPGVTGPIDWSVPDPLRT